MVKRLLYSCKEKVKESIIKEKVEDKRRWRKKNDFIQKNKNSKELRVGD